jgi:epoxide hydrolase
MTRPSVTMNPPRTDELVHPFRWHVPQSAIEDLQARLARTRWPDELPGTADYGAALMRSTS